MARCARRNPARVPLDYYREYGGEEGAREAYVELYGRIVRKIYAEWNGIDPSYQHRAEILRRLIPIVRDTYASSLVELSIDQRFYEPGMRVHDIYPPRGTSHDFESIQRELENTVRVYQTWIKALLDRGQRSDIQLWQSYPGRDKDKNKKEVVDAWESSAKSLGESLKYLSAGNYDNGSWHMGQFRNGLAWFVKEIGYTDLGRTMSRAGEFSAKKTLQIARQSMRKLAVKDRGTSRREARIDQKMGAAVERKESYFPAEHILRDHYRFTIRLSRLDPRQATLVIQKPAPSPVYPWGQASKRVPLRLDEGGTFDDPNDRLEQVFIDYQLNPVDLYRLYAGVLQRAGIPLASVFGQDTLRWISEGM